MGICIEEPVYPLSVDGTAAGFLSGSSITLGFLWELYRTPCSVV